jgi:hypothetical protein
MSIQLENTSSNLLKNNEEARVLREIFNLIEAKLENKEDTKQNKTLLEKYNIKNIKVENINGLENHPKNRFKSKLQKILFKKKL